MAASSAGLRQLCKVFGFAAIWLPFDVADAAPPPNADPALAPWFRSLQQPGSGSSCCSMADCRTTDTRIVDGHYEVFIEGEWRTVPPDKVLDRVDNPTGRAVVCWTPATGVMCFLRGPGV